MPVALHIALASAVALGAVPPGQTGEAAYRYHLSTTYGTIPMAAAFLSYDRGHGELFVMADGLVRVFNESGMEIFTFGDDPEVGSVRGVAALDDGDLLVQSYREGGVALVRCTFRGEFLRLVQPKGVPAGFEMAVWGRMRFEGGKLYFADLNQMKVLVTDVEGNTLASYDVARKLEISNPETVGLRGFNVDREGNVLFTIQPLFSAYTMSPDGTIQAFGQRGSAPGKFNIVGGIARDDDGYYYVADILKSAILVFDREFRWLREFGYRNSTPAGLAAPEELAAAGHGQVFISQNARRGVSVYQYQVSKRQAEASTGSL